MKFVFQWMATLENYMQVDKLIIYIDIYLWMEIIYVFQRSYCALMK